MKILMPQDFWDRLLDLFQVVVGGTQVEAVVGGGGLAAIWYLASRASMVVVWGLTLGISMKLVVPPYGGPGFTGDGSPCGSGQAPGSGP